jgi:hypothetical protein
MIPDADDLYQATKEMNLKLYQEKEKLVSQFLTRHQISGFHDMDTVMKNLLQDVEWVKDKPFEKVENKLVEMGAVYGTVLLQNIGGEWAGLEDGFIRIKSP